METLKARQRRLRAGSFAKYFLGSGIDVGVGRQESPGGEDKVTVNALGWDKDDGDAHYLRGVADSSQNWVHSSHCLEHLQDPVTAIVNWFRVIKPGGWLILLLPHRDLYEKSRRKPSAWNTDHKFFYLPDRDETPDTLGLLPLVARSLKPGTWRLESLHLACDGYWANGRDHPQGEYSFEAVVKKTAHETPT